MLLTPVLMPTLSLVGQPAVAQVANVDVRDDKRISLAPKMWGQVRVEILAGFPLTNSQVDSKVRAQDYEDGDISARVTRVAGDYSLYTPGTYDLEYEVEDSDGNKSSLTVPVTVFDLESWTEHRDKLVEQYPTEVFPSATAIHWHTTVPDADDWRLEVLKEAQSLLTEDEVEDKRQQQTLKSQAIEAYEGLGATDAAEYEEFIAALRRGGAPRVTAESVTVTDKSELDYSFVSAEDNEDGAMTLDESNTTFSPSLDSLEEGENSVQVTVTDSDGNSTTTSTTITITPEVTEEPTPTEEPEPTEEPTETTEPAEPTETTTTQKQSSNGFEFLRPLDEVSDDDDLEAEEPTPVQQRPAEPTRRQQESRPTRTQATPERPRPDAPRQSEPNADAPWINSPSSDSSADILAAAPRPSSNPEVVPSAPQTDQPESDDQSDEAPAAQDPQYPQEDYAISSEGGVNSQNPVPPAFLAVMGFFATIGAGMVVGPSLFAKFVRKP